MAIFKMFDDTTMCLYVIRSNTDSASRNVTLDARVFMPTGHAVSISMISDRDHIGRIIWERYEGHQLRRGSEKDFGHDRFGVNEPVDIWAEICKEQIAKTVYNSCGEPENWVAGYHRTPTHRETLAFNAWFSFVEEETSRDWQALRATIIGTDDWYYV